MTGKPNKEKKTMNTWPIKDDATFKKVTFKLCGMLDGDATALSRREDCKNDRQKAKDALKEAGDFDQIPAEVEVFIMENDIKANSKVVTVILPPKGEIPDSGHFEAKKYWVCTWHLYPQIMIKGGASSAE
jgi:hypothetical protein